MLRRNNKTTLSGKYILTCMKFSAGLEPELEYGIKRKSIGRDERRNRQLGRSCFIA
jgi:hypothetical protein